MKKQPLLSRAECTVLKGIAILGIIMHNFLHVMPGYMRENEYRFFTENVERFEDVLEHHSLHLPLQALSYVGFLTLAIFIMITGYGLAVKYESRPGQLKRVRFVADHYVKLLRLMAIPLLIFMLVSYLFDGELPISPKFAVVELLMLSPVFNTEYCPGPFWYFAMVMQLYVIYAFAVYQPTERGRRWSSAALVALTLIFTLVQWNFNREGGNLEWYRINALPYLPAFTLGVLLGRYANWNWLSRRKAWVALIVGTAVAYWCSTTFGAWMWIHLPVAVASLGLVKALPAINCGAMRWIGELSQYLFAHHATSRKIFWDLAVRHPVTWLIPYLAVSFALAAGHRWVAHHKASITDAFTRK